MLRCQPSLPGYDWEVELLAQDRDEPSVVLPLGDAWSETFGQPPA